MIKNLNFLYSETDRIWVISGFESLQAVDLKKIFSGVFHILIVEARETLSEVFILAVLDRSSHECASRYPQLLDRKQERRICDGFQQWIDLVTDHNLNPDPRVFNCLTAEFLNLLNRLTSGLLNNRMRKVLTDFQYIETTVHSLGHPIHKDKK